MLGMTQVSTMPAVTITYGAVWMIRHQWYLPDHQTMNDIFSKITILIIHMIIHIICRLSFMKVYVLLICLDVCIDKHHIQISCKQIDTRPRLTTSTQLTGIWAPVRTEVVFAAKGQNQIHSIWHPKHGCKSEFQSESLVLATSFKKPVAVDDAWTMVNCWFGAFGGLGFGLGYTQVTIPFIFGDSRNANHRAPNLQLTIGRMLQFKKNSIEDCWKQEWFQYHSGKHLQLSLACIFLQFQATSDSWSSNKSPYCKKKVPGT